MTCGPISLNVIPGRFWRPIVFHFCTETLLRRSGVNGPHGRVVPTGEARLLVTVGLSLGATFRTVQLVICRPVLPVRDPWVLITLPLSLTSRATT